MMKKAQATKKSKQSYKNEPILKLISQTQNQADNRKTASFGLQLFDKNSRDSSTCSSSSKAVEELEEKTLPTFSKKRKKSLTPSKETKMPKVIDELEDEIEKQLDSKAEKTNLSVVNVKNILKSVITNTDVLNMVRQSLSGEIECTYEPKLTRSKTKELLLMSPNLPLPPVLALTPVKSVPVSSECKVLIDQELSESSSDEEYNPNDEEPVSEDDEDKEAASSIVSDLDSLPMTPASVNVHDTSHVELLDDSVFVRPQENVGQRTRSKLSLSALPLEVIEQSFIPPDITRDMYESACDNDDWSDFLKEFCQPLDDVVNETIDDMEADPEYNVLADEEANQVDKEELRVDRAVKVSRKELNALMAELREYTDMISSEEDDNIDPSSFLPMSPILEEEENGCTEPQVKEMTTIEEIKSDIIDKKEDEEEEFDLKSIRLTSQQENLLSQQMRQHVQLITQHFLQTYKHPDLGHMAPKFKENLCTLYCLGSGKKSTYFRPSNLEPALEIVSEWEKLLNDPQKSQPVIKFMEKEIEKAKKCKAINKIYAKGDFPNEMKQLVFQSKAFIYPLLLPPQPFRSFDRQAVVSFTSHEDMLIALCLEQFIPYMKNNQNLYKKINSPALAKLLVELNMPHGNIRNISVHINRMKKQKKYNPIKYYFDTLSAPTVQHYIVPMAPALTLSQQPVVLLPEIWKKYLLESKTANYTNR